MYAFTAVVIFIGQGNYHTRPKSTQQTLGLAHGQAQIAYGQAQTLGLGLAYDQAQPLRYADPRNTGQGGQSNFGELMFVNDSGVLWNYQPALGDLKAKNTLFISLADYTERAFERVFTRRMYG